MQPVMRWRKILKWPLILGAARAWRGKEAAMARPVARVRGLTMLTERCLGWVGEMSLEVWKQFRMWAWRRWLSSLITRGWRLGLILLLCAKELRSLQKRPRARIRILGADVSNTA